MMKQALQCGFAARRSWRFPWRRGRARPKPEWQENSHLKLHPADPPGAMNTSFWSRATSSSWKAAA